MMDSVKDEQSNQQQQQAIATRRRLPRAAAKRKSATASDIRDEDAAKRKKTFDDFFNFCNFVLAYEEQLANSELHIATTNGTNGTNSAGESSHSTSPTHTSSSSSNSSDSSDDSASVGEEAPDTPSSSEAANERLEYTSDDESWNLVTCFCRRPFAGRPMIECNQCSTWVHLFCAKIKKEHVPEVYTCPKCRTSNTRKAKRKRVKVTKSVEKDT